MSLIWSGLSSKAQDIESHIKQLGDGDESVRRNAALALSQTGKLAVPALIKAINDEEGEVRVLTAAALKIIATSEAMKTLEEYERNK